MSDAFDNPLATFEDEAEPPQATPSPSVSALAGDAGSAFENEGGGKSPPLTTNSFEEEDGKKSPSSGDSKKNRQQLKELQKSRHKKLAAKNSGKAGQDDGVVVVDAGIHALSERIRSFDSSDYASVDFADDDLENGRSPQSGPVGLNEDQVEFTAQQVIDLFREFDLDGSGTLDGEDIMGMMERLGKPSDPDSVDAFMREIDSDAGGEVSLEEFITWWQTTGRFEHKSLLDPVHGYKQANDARKRFAKTLMSPLTKARDIVKHDETHDVSSKGVAPESIFVVDKTGNDGNRELMEASALVHVIFERDFHHLADVLVGQEGAGHWLSPWEQEAAGVFDEPLSLECLGWEPEVAAAGRKLFEERQEMARWRLFLQSNPLGASRQKVSRIAKINNLKTKIAKGDPDQDPLLLPTAENVVRVAQEFLVAKNDEHLLDAESIPFAHALKAVRAALGNEAVFRQGKLEGLSMRLAEHTTDTPRKMKVTGLRGDSANANGIYCADGLRAFWGRPLYIQQPTGGSSSHVLNYLYYDMRHESAESGHRWTDGTWVIGPSLNSERCTCWLADGDESVEHKYPSTTASIAEDEAKRDLEDDDDENISLTGTHAWHVFDTVSKAWVPAPGDHCPGFAISIVKEKGQTMREYLLRPPNAHFIAVAPDSVSIYRTYAGRSRYIQKAMDHQVGMLKRAQESLAGGSKFEEALTLTLGGHRDQDGNLSREAYVAWRSQYYHEEVNAAQSKLKRRILSRAKDLQLPKDLDDQREIVDEIITSFIWTCSRKLQERRLETRRFAARIERPCLSRAFFSWKFAWRQSSASSLSAGGAFAEPTLPWNVRHPRSTFTNCWEAAQAILLVYVSFNVIWRVTFNTVPEGIYFYIESVIDYYFMVDVILNFHTAFYDGSGDLQGLNPAGKGRGIWSILAFGSGADLKTLYSNYARGWMVIDVLSVTPWADLHSIIVGERSPNTTTSGSEAKVLKILRLLRLMKLLRVFRAMRILKKYEEELGPALSACILIGTVILAIHTITCCWYFVGTFGTLEDLGNGTVAIAGTVSTGWVEAIFKGSDRLCSCYNSAGEYDGDFTDGASRPYFYDAFESKCVHPTDLDAPIELVCHNQRDQIPGPWDYYYKALFTAIQDSSITSGYTHSIGELLGAALITAVMGFMWGAVAGAWSSIFQANQMAGQKFNEKMAHLKEFCRVKELDWGTRAKLVAYYEHLYPEGVIINETEIIDELPPAMRVDLVKQIYGSVIASVPLFFGLNTAILTELCMALVPLPALKGEVLLHEAATGTEMYCVADGSCRVTQRMRGGADEERVRIWIEEVFAAHYSITKLYEPNQKVLMEKLMKRLRFMAKSSENRDTVTYRELVNDEKILIMLETPRALMEATVTLNNLLALAKEQNRVSYRGLLRLPESTLNPLTGRRNAGVGPIIKLLPKEDMGEVKWESALEQMCGALKDGVILCRLLNFFLDSRKIDVWTEGGIIQMATSLATDAVDIAGGVVSGTASTMVTVADKTATMVPDLMGSKQLQMTVNAMDSVQDATLGKTTRVAQGKSAQTANLITGGPARNVQAFLNALQDTTRSFNTGDLITTAMATGGDGGKQHLFSADDLLGYNVGTLQEQFQKQKRVLACVLELGLVVSNLQGYMGVCIDEVNLGTLHPGEFFGELSLLPLTGGWRSARTITAVQNSMLYYITKMKIEWLASRFPDLKHKLHDHAEDYEKMLASGATQTARTGRGGDDVTQPTVEQDPLAIVKEQLAQQNVKLVEQELKLGQVDASLRAMVVLLQSIEVRLSYKGL